MVPKVWHFPQTATNRADLGLGIIRRMPIEFTILPEERLVVSRCTGVIAMRDVSLHQDQLAADPTFEPEFDQIFDARALERVDMGRAALIAIARRSPFSDDSRTAVITSDALGIGLAKVFGAMVKGGRRDLRVFAHIEEAKSWLAGMS